MTTATPYRTNIKQTVNRKPSVAVRAAIHGLQTARVNPNFVLHMGTYGDVADKEKNICFGCMATVTLQSIANTAFDIRSVGFTSTRAAACDANHNEVLDFEWAINQLRLGGTFPLYRFCELVTDDVAKNDLPTYVPGLPFNGDALSHAPNSGLGQLLSGCPEDNELDVAIARLTLLAELLESKGF